MKNLLFSFIAVAFMANALQGQITFEHSYTTERFSHDKGNILRTENGLYFYTFDFTIGILRIYDSSHALYKTVNVTDADGYNSFGFYAISDVLFNADNLIEFMVSYVKDDGTNYIFKLKLINENGSVLREFANKDEAIIVRGLSNSFKLITANSAATQLFPLQYDVYSLPGTILGVAQNQTEDNFFLGFPNPAADSITIVHSLKNGETGLLQIFDTNGKKVMEKNIIGTSAEINIDISDLSHGIYIYKLNGKTNRFIKK